MLSRLTSSKPISILLSGTVSPFIRASSISTARWTHLLAKGADAGDGGKGDACRLQIVEAADAELVGNGDPPPLALEQGAQRQVVVVAEDGVGIGRLCQERAEQLASEPNGGRLRRGDEEAFLQQAGGPRRVAKPFQAPLRARIHARAEKADAPVAALDQMDGGRASATAR
ncbi:hypothetical protein GCM10007923_36850 [Shinella yambaruensis]|uniref:Uncharacterized protein n=1 Tax=Shinella yambaruensis TaxID=415996 RepID=A0ABQ5ZLE8_9HYPH|nr:hypothetical protein GCM10007923_36850 [Shinella yambaruensis]